MPIGMTIVATVVNQGKCCCNSSSVTKISGCQVECVDMLGREVSVLVNEWREAGVHEVRCDGSNLASGVYLCRMQAGDFIQTRRLLLLK
jgi:hypothetical protein